MSCPHCRAELVADARFCPACGQAIVPTGATAAGSMAAASSPEADLVGREIGGRFRVVAKLGEGGMGSVYRAEQTSLHRPCAIKLLRPELSANPMLLRRFNAEAAAVAKLSHPNTVNIYDFGQDGDGSLFIAMELIEGRSLRAIVGGEAPLPPRRALAIAGQIAASLADAHAHDIVHRDLKPDNVMVQDRGRQRDVVRVLDFGIAKLRDDSRATQQAMTQAGDMLGTPQYMAPEQIKGETVDGRTDIYALGCILYEMLTGRQPFEAPSVMAMLSKHLLEAPVAPSARRPDLAIAPALDQLVLAAMMKDPRARPPTMEQYGEQIAAVAASLPADPARPSGEASAALPVPSPPPGGIYGVPAGPSFTPQVPYFAPPPGVAPAPGFTPPPGGARRGNPGLWIALACVGAVVLGAGAWGIGVALRSHGPVTPPAAPPQAQAVDPEPDDPQPPDPQPAPDPGEAPAPSPPAPSPAPDPWAGDTPPSAAPAGAAGPSCEDVAAHLRELMILKVRAVAAQLTPQQAAQLQQGLAQGLRTVLTACSTQAWPVRLRACFMRATSYEQAAQCK